MELAVPSGGEFAINIEEEFSDYQSSSAQVAPMMVIGHLYGPSFFTSA
jgi:hypothetical protein